MNLKIINDNKINEVLFIKSLNIVELIDTFIENAVIQGESTLDGDYKKGNKASDKLFKLGKLMSGNSEIARQMLDVLMLNENINVRIWAAATALDLRYKMEEAINILRVISQISEAGIIGFNAEMSLKVRGLVNVYSLVWCTQVCPQPSMEENCIYLIVALQIIWYNVNIM